MATNRIHISKEDDNNYLKVVKTLAKTYVSEFNYTENHVTQYENNKVGVLLYKNFSSLEQIPLTMPKIDFQNCSKIIKDKYNIE